MTMLSIPTKRFRKRRGRIKARAAQARPPAALVLVRAAYAPDARTVALTFDRPVQHVDFAAGAIVVDDLNFTGLAFEGSGGVTFEGPSALVLGLVETGSATGADVTLTASAGTGIVA